MVIVEKNFPRGGSNKSQENKSPAEKIIFGALQKKSRKVKSKSKTIESDNNNEFGPAAFSAELLNYDTIQEGMVLMGMVKAIDAMYLTISLPGRIIARTSVLEISDAYTKITKQFFDNPKQVENYKPLNDLYKVGQVVYGRVLELQYRGSGKRPHINLTFKPGNVHSELSHTGIKKSFIFNGAIEEIQEHGYIVETGIRGLRSFIPLEKAKNDSMVVGELVYLRVIKITQDNTASTCICKQVKVDKLNIKNIVNPTIEYILPSTIVQFEVTKRLKDGLQGTLMNGLFTAYANEHQLTEPLSLPEDFEVNQTLSARILYVMPLTKLVYVSLNLSPSTDGFESEDKSTPSSLISELKRGDIIENAKVDHAGTGGIILILKNKFKGIISYKSIKANYKGNYDQDELLLKYAKKSKHNVRIIDYDLMGSMYICSDSKTILNEKFFDLNDLRSGDFVSATVVERNAKIGGYSMQVGKFKGIIENLFLASSTKQLDANMKVRCRIMSINVDRRILYLTNRLEYMSKNCKVLTSLEDAKCNGIYTGTIVNCGTKDGYLLVRFFNDIKGQLSKSCVNNAMVAEMESFDVGQTMSFRILQRNNDKLMLTLPEDVFNVGEIRSVTVVHTLESGLEIKVPYDMNNDAESDTDVDKSMEQKGLIPTRFLSNFLDLLHAKLRLYSTEMTIDAVCIVRNIFSVRDVPYFRKNMATDWNSVQVGDVLKAYVKNLKDEIVELWLPIRGYSKLVMVHLKMLLMNTYKNAQITLTPDQVIYVKIIGKAAQTKTLTVSAKLVDVWSGDLSTTSCLLEKYLTEVATIRSALTKQKKAIAKYRIGDKITCTFQGIHSESGDWCYEVTNTKTPLVVRSSIANKAKTLKLGDQQECIILWIDYSKELLFASNRFSDLTHFSSSLNLPENLAGKSGINAKVLLKLDNVFICSLKKGLNPLVYCPTRLHYNDFENSSSINIREGEFCRLTFIHKTKPIAVPDSTWKLWSEANRKRKAQENLESLSKTKKHKNESSSDDMEPIFEKDKKTTCVRKIGEIDALEEIKDINEERNLNTKLKKEGHMQMFYEDKVPEKTQTNILTNNEGATVKHLSGVKDFWTTDLTQLNSRSNATDSSEEDEDGTDSENEASPRKKKRISAVEKFKQQRDEEERLRAIELKYADPNQLPESIDQFDRLVMSEPNNSLNWINYMVFHLQSTEIDKARAVARRAIRTINFHNSDDLLNMWIALLNLELRYGNKESYEETLKEALMYNDPLRVYIRLVEVLSDAKCQSELIELIANLTKKFKSEREVWTVSADALFRLGMIEKAQQLLHKGLACIPDREHVGLIVTFANLNHKHGQQEMGQTLLDQVITSYPKRVDVWTQYVDMLVKSNLIDSARNVLERAIIQKIPIKKMRTLFKKYLDFEERYGDARTIQNVKASATKYVKNNTKI